MIRPIEHAGNRAIDRVCGQGLAILRSLLAGSVVKREEQVDFRDNVG